MGSYPLTHTHAHTPLLPLSRAFSLHLLFHPTAPSVMSMVGGLGAAKPADSDAQAAADAVKGAVESQVGDSFDKFEVKSYATQVVAGTMMYLKVDTGKGFVHAKVFRSLPPATHELKGVQSGKSEADELTHFE